MLVRAQLDNGNITARVTHPKGVRDCPYTVVTRVYTWLHSRPAAIRTGPFHGLGRYGILLPVTGSSSRWA
jgi:hypothetical protein